MRYPVAPIFGALSLLHTASSYSVFDLSDAAWTLSDPGNNVSVPATIPSHVHLDLFKAGVIPDPYFGLGDFELRWVTYSNWTYAATLPASSFSAGDATWLVFNGLDTFTSISLCGQHVAATNNQFRQYFFEVSDILSSCNGTADLSINFGSAVNISAAIAEEPGQETWAFGIQNIFEFPNRWLIRKEQSDFGWDWGPAFAPAGPWLPAFVASLSSNDVYVRNTLIDIYRQGQLPLVPPDQSQPWVVNVSLDYLGSLPPDATLRYTLTDSSNATVASGSLSNITSSSGVIGGTAMLEDGAVDLWWPAGLGAQTLYNIEIDIVGSSNAASVTKRVGFRTIVLNQFPITAGQIAQGIAPGNNWHFEVNGQTFYAKGSNFIPPDAFWPRVTPANISKILDSAIFSHQNMFRVWGSGAYSPDFMYDLADERGILLWSEFEFGDALYPVNEEFLANVADEVNYQSRRVNHHPSLAFWAGGNELESLELFNLARAHDRANFDRLLSEYETLFLDLIVPILFGNTHSISYSPSSTSNGWLSLDFNKSQPITQRYQNLTSGSLYGDTEHYNYDSSVAFKSSSYPVGRFSNEFGYHSMPSLQSWQDVLDPSDLHFNSSTIQLRNHHYPAGGPFTNNFANTTKGMGEMTIAVQRWYPAPDKTDSLKNFSSWCHATQVFQADFYKSQLQFYRRGSGLRERELGVLWWQLEDIWQAPTWSAIEYSGRWKVLQYTGRDVFQNVIIAPFINPTNGDLDVYVTSDLWEAATGTATFTWLDWTGKVLNVNTATSIDFTVGAINSTRVLNVNLTNTLAGFDLTNVVMRMSVTVTGSLPNSDATQTFNHTNWFHAAPLSQAKLVDPGLEFSFDSASMELTVQATTGVSAWTWIDYPHGAILAFEDNGFWMQKGETRTIGVLKVWEDNTNGAWTSNVTVESLWNQTQPT